MLWEIVSRGTSPHRVETTQNKEKTVMTNRDNSRMKSRITHFAKAGRSAALGVALLAQATLAATYSYDSAATQRTLYVDVANGETETFDAAYMEPAGASVTNIVKRGDGTLQVTSDTPLTAYTFDIRVEDGIFKFAGKLALGTRTAANAGTITVCDGATIQNTSAASNAGIGANWTTHIIGEGHNGMGALYKTSYSYGGPFGNWVLDGDAKAVMFSSAQDNMYSVDLNGHVLDLHLQSGWFIEVSRIENGGEIRVHGNPSAASNYTRFRNWNGFYGGAENLISFSNTTWQIENMRQYLTATPGLDWSMAFEDKSAMRIVAGTYKGGTIQNNSWNGPVVIRRGMLPVSVPADKGELGFAFKGAVSGGGFDLQGLDTTTLSLRLANSGNTFTNGITGQYADLRLAANGALPATGGPLALTNSTVTLEDSSATWSLPAAEFSGTGSVTGGRGAWASLAKTGAGTLAYDSAVGGPTLDIAEGTVDFTSLTNRTAFAGLVEGRKHLTQSSSATDRYVVYQMAASWKGSTETNAITQGTRLLYDWTRDPDTGWTTNLLLSYEGYIWNNSPTNELWAFAGGGTEGSDWHLKIDGQTAVGKCIWSSSRPVCFCDGVVAGNFAYDLHTNTVVMTPGPHRFEYRHAISLTATGYGLALCGGISGYGNYKDTLEEPKYEKWRAACGLMFNRTGKCTRNIADYEELIDPGDGSLLTWDIPPASGTLPHPVTGEAVSLTPVFSSLRMGPGTSMLVPDGSTWTFADVEGWPTVTGGNVAVTDTFTADGENAGRASFAIDGTLTFDPGAQIIPPGVDVRPPDRGRVGQYVLGTANGGISGSPAAARNSHWKVFVEGNAVKAVFIPEHTLLLLQ